MRKRAKKFFRSALASRSKFEMIPPGSVALDPADLKAMPNPRAGTSNATFPGAYCGSKVRGGMLH